MEVIESASPGKRLEFGKLDGHGKRLLARMCNIPFVAPEKSRPQSVVMVSGNGGFTARLYRVQLTDLARSPIKVRNV